MDNIILTLSIILPAAYGIALLAALASDVMHHRH